MDRRELLVIVPTRSRPDNAVQLAKMWDTTVSNISRCDLLFVTDDDDDSEYPTFDKMPGISIETGPRRRLGPTLNAIAVREAPNYFALGFMGDDHRPRTAGWPTAVMDALQSMGTGIVYGDDLFQRANLPTAWFMTSDIVATLGYMTPPELIHLYLDNFVRDFGSSLNRLQYLPHIIIEHMHPNAGKTSWDPLYDEVNSSEMYTHDELAYDRYIKTSFTDDVAKVRKVML